MVFNIFLEYFWIIVACKANRVISIRSNSVSEIESPDSISKELGECSIQLGFSELQKKIDVCSSLIFQANNELMTAKSKLSKKSTEPKDNEKVEELTRRVEKINLECNKFVDLLLLKRIYRFDGISVTDVIKDVSQVEEKLDEMVKRFVITERNAAFIRSLISKTKCNNFRTNEHCKILTGKLLYYMAVTPKEVVENFENVKITNKD
ncbi:hypothetical protein OJ253_1685 [Cryptosporidium canis]|uniref:Uncharacterized protein n=1 Tax=Cryptosporidium canis TaxID=195482 RepID=A0A9D5DGL5_9CRYT|nr:hypothetical protein OJ253_1685 [Cryptosporidium canis]